MSKEQILIIDDEQTIRSVIERTLRNERFELIFAENGAQGLELLKQNNPVIIVLDLKMPKVDGISFLKKINLKPDDPYGVIVLTGNGSDEEMQVCYDLGAHLFLRKPFGYTEFLCQIHRLITLKQLEKKVRNESIVAKECFSNSINHELRTPLHIISTSLSLIGRNSLPEKQRIFYDFIKNASNDLLQKINRILDYNTVKNGDTLLEPENFNLFDFVTEITREYEQEAIKKGVAFSFIVSDTIPTMIHTDRKIIGKIISNLLSNAVKFTDKGKIDFQVNLHSHENELLMLLFTIQDTGIGISETKKQLIFEQFKQGDEELTREKGGVGIGLTLAYHLVKFMNGSLSLTSSLGKGSSFNVIIPCRPPLK